MITFLTLVYSSFYFLVFGKGWVQKTPRNLSIFVGVGVVLISAIVFAWLTVAPTSEDGRVFQYVLQVVSDVSGPVVEVPAEPLVPMEKGEVIFKIDPVPFQAKVDQLMASIDQTDAQRRLAQLEVDRSAALVTRGAGSRSDLDRWTAERDGAVAAIKSLEAQLSSAQWDLDKTVVRASASGYLVNLQVQPGVAVRSFAGTPAGSFVSEDAKYIVASYSQSSIRKIEVGNAAEMVFPMYPGEVFAGTVTHVIKATGTAQVAPSGAIPVMSGAPAAGRYVVRIQVDDAEALARLPQGASCTVATYADAGKPFHVISKVVMRIDAWKAYLTSPV